MGTWQPAPLGEVDKPFGQTFIMVREGTIIVQPCVYESIAGVGETGVWLRADFQSGSRVLKKVF